MTNFNEFFGGKSEKPKSKYDLMERIEGSRPCFKCNKDTDGYYFDASAFTMYWICSDGHENSMTVN
jgi:hypothetical protein